MAKPTKFDQMISDRIEAEKSRIAKEVIADYLQTVPSFDVPLKQFLSDMESAGMGAVLTMSVSDLASAIKKATRASGPRFDKATRERLAATTIPELLKSNGPSTLKTISENVGFEARKVKKLTDEMVADGRLAQDGTGASATYSLPG